MTKTASLAIIALWSLSVSAHPGTALVVDHHGSPIFAYWAGTWTLDQKGHAERIHANDLHFLAIDLTGRFAATRLKDVLRLTPDGARPALFAFPESPGVFHSDGDLYSVLWSPGRIKLLRVTPDGQQTVFVDTPIDPRIARTPGRHEGGLLAVASGPNRLLYVSDGASIWSINPQGVVSAIVENVAVPNCAMNLPTDLPRPHIRSLAIDSDGNIYAAAIGCRAVVRITASGAITTVLRADAPWSPTAVAVDQRDVYVMEYDNPLAERPSDGRPRIRKLAHDGRVTTLVVQPTAKEGR